MCGFPLRYYLYHDLNSHRLLEPHKPSGRGLSGKVLVAPGPVCCVTGIFKVVVPSDLANTVTKPESSSAIAVATAGFDEATSSSSAASGP